jgi:hypothetical protein
MPSPDTRRQPGAQKASDPIADIDGLVKAGKGHGPLLLGARPDGLRQFYDNPFAINGGLFQKMWDTFELSLTSA